MLKGIKLSKSLEKEFSGSRFFGIIENFRQLNTFVGANNSGKSRFLRALFSNSQEIKFLFDTEQDKLDSIKFEIKDILTLFKGLERHSIIYSYNFLITHYSELIDNGDDTLNSIIDFYWFVSTLTKSEFQIDNNSNSIYLKSFLSRIGSRVKKLGSLIDKLGEENQKFNKIYIPILRGLRPLAKSNQKFSNDNIYLNRTKHDYFKHNVPNGDIFTGLSIYEKVKKLLLGNEDERNEIREFEAFLTSNVFKKKINLIPKYDDDVLHIKIGKERQFPIHNLGDGLQTLIIILFPIFINRDRQNLIFIEEPETHLHPKWQRLLYRAMSLFENHTFFISTHSSVFINSANNSIFVVSKTSNKTNLHYSDIKTEKIAILKDLGYKPNDLYQTNYLLWVEGQSDKVYLNHFIKQIDDKLIEGEDYSIMFYGGSSYKHFLENKGELNLKFIESLNQNYAIIMDSDRTKARQRYSPKKKKIVELFKKNKAFCWLTKYREMENYVPFPEFKNAVKSVHKIKNIEIDDSHFADRCKYLNLDAKPTFKPTIKLSNQLFSQIQKNKDGSLKGITDTELRKEIGESISNTKKSWNTIDKIKVAEKLVRDGVRMQNEELIKKVSELVSDIRKANN